MRGTFSAVKGGAINAEVAITLPGGAVVHAVVTRGAMAEIGLKPGVATSAVINASQVVLAAQRLRPALAFARLGQARAPKTSRSVVVVFELVTDGRDHDRVADDLEDCDVPGAAELDHEFAQHGVAPVARLAAARCSVGQAFDCQPNRPSRQQGAVEIVGRCGPLQQGFEEPVQILFGLCGAANDEPQRPITCLRRAVTFASSLSKSSSVDDETPVRL